MAGDVRSLLRAAQEAEARGEIDEAAQFLRRAAGLCEDGGKPARALQLLRYAVRLKPEASAIGWLERLEAEAGAGEPARAPVQVLEFPAEVSLEEAVREATVHALGLEGAQGPWIAVRVDEEDSPEGAEILEEAEPDRAQRRFIEERRATLAPPGQEAWCSFCCRPGAETGALVAGPAGAYLCRSCLADAGRLLGLPAATSTFEVSADVPARERSGPAADGPLKTTATRAEGPGAEGLTGPEPQVRELLLEHHSRVLTEVEHALREGRRCVLLLGPQGSGRSTCLGALLARVPDAALVTSLDALPQAGVWLLDDPQDLDPGEWRSLSRALATRPHVRLVIAARADPDAPAPAITVSLASGELPLWSTSELLVAAPGLGASLATRVDAVVSISLPAEAALARLAGAMLQAERPLLAEPLAAAQQLASLAVRSGRGMHELMALVQRIPRGPARLAHPPAAQGGGSGSERTRSPRLAGGQAVRTHNPLRAASRPMNEQRTSGSPAGVAPRSVGSAGAAQGGGRRAVQPERIRKTQGAGKVTGNRAGAASVQSISKASATKASATKASATKASATKASSVMQARSARAPSGKAPGKGTRRT